MALKVVRASKRLPEFLRKQFCELYSRPERWFEAGTDGHRYRVDRGERHLCIKLLKEKRQILFMLPFREHGNDAAEGAVQFDLGRDEVRENAKTGRVLRPCNIHDRDRSFVATGLDCQYPHCSYTTP